MYNTFTNTATYTVTDIRKTFEGFDADFRMIADRTETLTQSRVEDIIHDIMCWAEEKYIKSIDITLLNSVGAPIKATRFTVNENGQAISSERAGRNEWYAVPNSQLAVIVGYSGLWNSLTTEQRQLFMNRNGIRCNWPASSVNTSYSNLSKESAQLYASKGYELKKENFK